MWWLAICVLVITLLYYKTVKPYSYWKDKGVPYVKPRYIFGNLTGIVLGNRSLVDIITDIYQTYPNERYVGFYTFLKPVLMIRDLELIKKITIKDFDVFPNHKSNASPEVDPLWCKNLFSMTVKEGWNDMRATLSPAFTSVKMKTMFPLMQQCAKQFVDHFEQQDEKLTKVELKDAFARFATDIIGSTAFGVTCNSLKDRDNEFYAMGRDISNFSGLKGLKMLGYGLSPTLMKILKIRIFGKAVSAFFRNLIKDTIKIREENQIIRPDMVHLLTEARKGCLVNDSEENVPYNTFSVAKNIGKKQKADLTDDDITAQALIFFLAGLEAASTLMSVISYELAIHPDIQSRLYKEVKDTFEKCNGSVTYESLLGMTYLDMVVSEALRLLPPQSFLERESVKSYIIEAENSSENFLHLEKGTEVWIPICSIQNDPVIFPNPEKFDPERFNDTNKEKIKSLSYMSFGAGPRICIGSRFALLETKLIITELLRNFEIVPIEETPIPLKLQPAGFHPRALNGFWVGFNHR